MLRYTSRRVLSRVMVRGPREKDLVLKRRFCLKGRYFSSGVPVEQGRNETPPNMSVDQALASSRMVLDLIRFGVSGVRLDGLLQTQVEIEDKWSRAMQILVQTQAHCAVGFGYPATSEGVTLYRQHFSACASIAPSDTLEELKSLDRQLWDEVLLRGFALAPRTISLEDARNFSSKVASTIADNHNLGTEIMTQMAQISTLSDSDQEKQLKQLRIIQRSVSSIQRSVAPEFGFDGPDGYIQLQAALVHHMADPVVLHTTNSIMHTISAKTGLTLT